MHAIDSMFSQSFMQSGRPARLKAGLLGVWQAGRQDKSALFWRFREYEATVQGPQRASARRLFVCPKEMAEGGGI